MSSSFATSCTVVSRPAFIRLIGRLLPGEMLQALWAAFWVACGLIVVKGYHMAEFAVLFLLCRWALRSLGRGRATLVSIAFCLIFAASDEWHQTFVRGRGGTWSDVVIDMGGVLLAALLTTRIERSRVYQVVLITSLLGLSWLGMQIVHEAGHVLLAWASGEKVSRVVLHPLVISRTDVSHESHPLLVIWGGPSLGSVLPLVALGIAKALRSGGFYLFRFFAGFCLIANGLYVSIGSFSGVGDAWDLLLASLRLAPMDAIRLRPCNGSPWTVPLERPGTALRLGRGER